MAQVSQHVARNVLRMRGWRSHRVYTAAGRVHVLEGENPRGAEGTVVMLHGLGSSGVHWWSVMGAMRHTARRVILPDMPGHGFSDMPPEGLAPATLRAGLLDSLDQRLREPAVLVGNSMGGLGAIEYALARPERVRGLVLMSPGGAPMGADDIPTFVERFRVRSHRDALDFVDRLFARRAPMRHALAWGVRRTFAQPGIATLLQSLSPEHLLAAEHLAALRVPVVLIWGRGDRVLPDAHREFFVRHLPRGTRVLEPAHVGHSPYLEDPALVIREVRALLSTLGPPRLRPGESLPAL
jgi:pimeloyl-ACP methyl ester carboxylesterase